MNKRFGGGISIICPIYNGEETIRRCANSIKEQDFENFECIFVDDGSIDGSRKICQEICKRDGRFKYYCLECNKGVSTARNKGISLASKEYLVFIDCDDIYNQSALRSMISCAEKHPDIEAIQFGYVVNNLPHYNEADIGVRSSEGFLKDANTKKKLYYLSRWIFKTNCIKDKVKFDVNLPMGEDTVFLLNVIIGTRKIMCDKTPVFTFIGHDNSATRRYRKDLIDELDALYLAKKTIYQNNGQTVPFDLMKYTAEHNFLLCTINEKKHNVEWIKRLQKSNWFQETKYLQSSMLDLSIRLKLKRNIIKYGYANFSGKPENLLPK